MGSDYERARRLYENGQYGEALEAYLSLAEATQDPSVFSFIGRMYCQGQGVASDEAEGLRWYVRAAETGDPRAMLYLAGFLSKRGQFKQAKEWLEAATGREYGPAFFFLGRMYQLGRGVKRDNEIARRYFEQAAQKEYVWAEKEIALRMLRGEYGILAIPKGMIAFFTAIAKGVRIGRSDPDDDRIRV